MDSETLYHQIREVAEQSGAFIPDNADQHLGDACEAMMFNGEENEGEQEQPTYEYHFDVGNSNTGPIGLCASVTATCKQEAVKLLRELLADHDTVKIANDKHVDYVNVYINSDKLKKKHIDQVEPTRDG